MIAPGATVLGMGTYQQVHDEFALSADKLVPDSWAQAVGRGEMKPLIESNKISNDDLYAEIGDIVAEKCPGRESKQERIFGLPVGIGAHDLCLANAVYQAAKKMEMDSSLNCNLRLYYEPTTQYSFYSHRPATR
jgi:ornithine cyclodeaminase/alanine dehydrogenase-like protein (mu-crystallin family)